MEEGRCVRDIMDRYKSDKKQYEEAEAWYKKKIAKLSEKLSKSLKQQKQTFEMVVKQ